MKENLLGVETWEQVAELEPRFEQLLIYAQCYNDPGERYFCANEIWDNLFKPQVMKLLGWNKRPLTTHAEEVWAFW